MKKNIILLIIVLVLGCINTNAQTVIGKKTADGDAVLDFASGTTRGVILPAVETLPATPANGTFLLDKNDSTIKMYEDGVWVALSASGNTDAVVDYSGTVDNGKQTVIGALETTVDGVLVLESPDKALVLPKIADPHLNVKSPYPGMICYDTTKKAMAVFNGGVWSYWQ